MSCSAWCYSILPELVKEKEVNITAVILLQIVMVSPGTHFVKNRESQSRISESQSRISESQLKKKTKQKKKTNPKLKMLWPSCNQTVNLQRTPKLFTTVY